MPNVTVPPTRGQEPLRKIEQRARGSGCRNRDTEIGSTQQEPSMITVNSSIPKIKRHATDVAPAVIENKKEPSGQAGEPRFGTQASIQLGHQRPHIDQATTDSGERRCDDIAHPLVGVGWQEPRVPHRSDERDGHGVWQAAKLDARARGELKITAAKLLSDPAQPADCRTSGLSTGNPDPHNGAILGYVGP